MTKLVVIGEDIFFGDHAACNGNHQFADFPNCGLARINKDSGATDRFVIGFSHVGGKCADQIQMSAGLKPGAVNQRQGSHGCATDNVGCCDSLCQVINGRSVDFSGEHLDEGVSSVSAAIPDLHTIDRRPGGEVGPHQMRCKATCSYHEQSSAVGS